MKRSIVIILAVSALSVQAQPQATSSSLNIERARVDQLFEQVEDQQKAVSGLEAQMGESGNQRAGRIASTDEVQRQINIENQSLQSLQAQMDQVRQRQEEEALAAQDDMIEDEVERGRTLQSVQAQLEDQNKRVQQLAQAIQFQLSTRIDSTILESEERQMVQERQKQSTLADELQALEIQSKQQSAESVLSQKLRSDSDRQELSSLAEAYAQGQKRYQSLQEDGQQADQQEQEKRQQLSATEDAYAIEHERLLQLEDAYSKEAQKLAQMARRQK